MDRLQRLLLLVAGWIDISVSYANLRLGALLRGQRQVETNSSLLAGPAAIAGDPFEIEVYDGTANAPGVPGMELHVNDWATGNREATPCAPSRAMASSRLEGLHDSRAEPPPLVDP